MFTYSIAINSEDIWQVIPELGYVSEINSGDAEGYELFIATPSEVYFEVFECFGHLNLAAASSLTKLQKKQYDIPKTLTGVKRVDFHTIFNFNITTAG